MNDKIVNSLGLEASSGRNNSLELLHERMMECHCARWSCLKHIVRSGLYDDNSPIEWAVQGGVTTLIAAALGKIVLYAADATERPASLFLETGDLDFSTVGLKEATLSQTLRRSITYRIGIRHPSTAILSVWASTATPDLNGGTPVTTARKVLRRTLTYATAASGTWG